MALVKILNFLIRNLTAGLASGCIIHIYFIKKTCEIYMCFQAALLQLTDVKAN